METPKVIVNKIKETSSPETMQLELYMETERENANSAFATMMAGHSKVSPNIEKRLCWPSVTPQWIKDLGIEESENINDALKKQGLKMRLKLIEATNQTFDPFGRVESDEQREKYRNAKINPVTQEALVKDGEDIYRSVCVDLKKEHEEFDSDVVVQHDNVTVAQQVESGEVTA